MVGVTEPGSTGWLDTTSWLAPASGLLKRRCFSLLFIIIIIIFSSSLTAVVAEDDVDGNAVDVDGDGNAVEVDGDGNAVDVDVDCNAVDVDAAAPEVHDCSMGGAVLAPLSSRFELIISAVSFSIAHTQSARVKKGCEHR